MEARIIMSACGCSTDQGGKCPFTLFVAGVVTIVLGVLAMMAPFATGVIATTLIGVFAVGAGISRMVLAFRASSFGKGILGFVVGVLTVLSGLVIMGHPLLGMATLALILAGYFVVDGIAEIAFSFQLKPRAGWGWMLFGGIVSLLLGISLWRQWPISGLWAIGILVGIKLIAAGWTMIALKAAMESATACDGAPQSSE